jgi:hypothetical protein
VAAVTAFFDSVREFAITNEPPLGSITSLAWIGLKSINLATPRFAITEIACIHKHPRKKPSEFLQLKKDHSGKHEQQPRKCFFFFLINLNIF